MIPQSFHVDKSIQKPTSANNKMQLKFVLVQVKLYALNYNTKEVYGIPPINIYAYCIPRF